MAWEPSSHRRTETGLSETSKGAQLRCYQVHKWMEACHSDCTPALGLPAPRAQPENNKIPQDPRCISGKGSGSAMLHWKRVYNYGGNNRAVSPEWDRQDTAATRNAAELYQWVLWPPLKQRNVPSFGEIRQVPRCWLPTLLSPRTAVLPVTRAPAPASNRVINGRHCNHQTELKLS